MLQWSSHTYPLCAYGAGTVQRPGWATVGLTFCFQLAVLLVTMLVALSRRDLFCIGYFALLFFIIFRCNIFDADTHQRQKWWARLRKLNYFLLLLHMVWVLPAALIQ